MNLTDILLFLSLTFLALVSWYFGIGQILYSALNHTPTKDERTKEEIIAETSEIIRKAKEDRWK